MARRSTILALVTALVLGLVPSAWAASTYATTVVANPSLVSFWRLSEQGAQTDAEGMTAADATGANPGIYHLGVNLGVQGSLEGDPDTAAHLGTPDGYAEIPYASALNTSQFTIEGWVEPDTAASYMSVVGNGAQVSDHTGFLVVTGSFYGQPALDFVFGDGTANHLVNGVVYTPGQWYYFAATYDGTTVRFYVDGQQVGSMTTGYQPNSALPMLIGLNPVIGNSGQLVGSVDDVAYYRTALSAGTIQQNYQLGIDDGVPPATTLESAPPRATNQTSATFGFTSDSVDPTYQCRLDGGSWQSCSSPYQVSDLANGKHQFLVRAIDRGGRNDPNPPSASWTVDTTPPITSFSAGPPSSTNSTLATFSFSSKPGATYTCQLDGGPALPCSSPYSIGGLTDGPHALLVEATDAAGNVEPTPATYSWSVDTAAPTTFIAQGPTGQHLELPFVFGANKPGVTFRCEVDTGPWEPCTSPFTRIPRKPGTHTFRVVATDALGNVDPSDHAYTWTVPAKASLYLKISFPRQIATGPGSARPTLSWRVGETGMLSLTVIGKNGRRVAHAAVPLRKLAGMTAVPSGLVRRLGAGRYTALLQATANGLKSMVLRVGFTVAR